MGQHKNSIDAKNRMIVPAKFRNQLGDGCIITVGLGSDCLAIYSKDYWEVTSAKLAAIPDSDLDVKKYKRAVFGNAEVCTFDKQGRIIIPENLIEYAHITKDLITMGVGTQIEVWAKEVWESPDNSGIIDQETVAQALSQYGF